MARGDDISMTWPAYRRYECLYRGRRVRMAPAVAELLSILLLNRGRVMATEDVLAAMWPGEDGGPLWAENMVRIYTRRLRLAMPGLQIVCFYGRGIMLPLPIELAEAA